MTNHLIAANAVTRLNSIHCLDAIDLLNALWFAGVKVDCIITSPPYFGLRSYLPDNHPDKEKEIGLEQSMNAYIGNMRRVFRAAYRVLKDTGTLWLNLGDTYNGGGTGFGTKSRGKNNSPLRQKMERINKTPGLPDKCKMMIPHRVAIGLVDDGWILRQDNVWHKKNCMPESTKDRTTNAHEYIFQLAKSRHYYYDRGAIGTPVKEVSKKRADRAVSATHKNSNGAPGQAPQSLAKPRLNKQGAYRHRRYTGFNARYEPPQIANKRSVWQIGTSQYKDTHFATFPEELVTTCLLAGCPENGIVLDMFGGSGTVGLVAMKHNRRYILNDLNPEYVELAQHRIAQADPYQDTPISNTGEKQLSLFQGVAS